MSGGKAVPVGSDGPPARRHLGAARQDDSRADQGEGALSLPAAAVPGSRRRGNALPEDDDRRPPAPHALRSGLRPAGARPARQGSPDLPDDAPGPGRRLEGQGHHARELLRDLQRPPEPEAARRPAPPGDAVPAAAVQRHRGPADGPGRRHDRRHLLRLPRQRAHQQGHAPGRRHPARRSSGTGSTRRPCAA